MASIWHNTTLHWEVQISHKPEAYKRLMYSLYLTDTKSAALREPLEHQEALVWYIILPQQLSFLHKKWSSLWRKTKKQLINICEELQNDKDFIDSYSHKLVLLNTRGWPVEITRGRVIPLPDISTNHEEADNIIFQQTFMAVGQGAECLSVMADDTDSYILLVHYYNQNELNIPMFMESPVHGRQTVDIRATAKEHANILPNLLAAHGLSGCDTVAPCYDIGEMKILKTLKQGNHSLSCLGDSIANWPDVVKQATSFMLTCYGVPKLDSMTHARANLWKTRVGRGSSTMPKLCSLLPTEKPEKGTFPDKHMETCTHSQCPWLWSCTIWVD